MLFYRSLCLGELAQVSEQHPGDNFNGLLHMSNLLDWPRLPAIEHGIHSFSIGVKARRVAVPGIGLEL